MPVPSSVWELAVSRIAEERNHGYASLCSLLRLFGTVLNVEVQENSNRHLPWIKYRRRMWSILLQGKTLIDDFEAPIHPRFRRDIKEKEQTENCTIS